MNNLKKNWLEWSVFAVGLVLVVGTLGYLAYDAITQGSDPARIEVKLGSPREVSTSAAKYYVVPVSAHNKGDHTAEAVVIEVVLEKDGKEVETSQFELSFVPRRSQAEGQVVFSKDPRAASLKPRVVGYEEP